MRSVKPKKTKSKGEKADELRSEYDLGKILKDGVQGKYADCYREGTNLVVLASDVAQAFPTDEAVNEALRLVIRLSKLPGAEKKTTAKRQTVEVPANKKVHSNPRSTSCLGLRRVSA